MRSLNKVMLIGNLGKDPEIQHFDSGSVKAKFSLATSDSYKTKEGQQVDTTEWHNIVMWRGLAGIAEKYLKKGSKVYIEGRIKTRDYTDKEGNKKYITEIEANQMLMLDRAGASNADGGGAEGGGMQNSNEQPYQAQQPNNMANVTQADPADDLPF